MSGDTFCGHDRVKGRKLRGIIILLNLSAVHARCTLLFHVERSAKMFIGWRKPPIIISDTVDSHAIENVSATSSLTCY